MDTIYREWINENYPTPLSARTACVEATIKMFEDFPELSRVRGQIAVREPHGLPPTRTTHWWLVDMDSNIIDPTGHQFPTEILQYYRVDESRGEPTGKCPNCGGLCYGGNYLCCDRCGIEYEDYIKDCRG